MKDKEKTAEILKRIMYLETGWSADGLIKIPEFRLGSGYGGISEKRIDVFAISPNKGNKTICFEIKVSRADFMNDIKKEDKQTPARCFSNEFYYCTPKGLLSKDDVPVWAGLIEFDIEKEAIYNGYYAELHHEFIKHAPVFDKALPTWGMVVSAFRNSGYINI